MNNRLIEHLNDFERIVLINAPAVDFRLPWYRWQQPVGLLRIGTYLRAQGHDVRFVDCLQVSTNSRLRREKVGRVEVEGYNINLWRFGLSPNKVIAILREWQKQNWEPDVVLVSSGMSVWCQGTNELINQIKKYIQAPVILGGPYPTFYSEHATLYSGADMLFIGDVQETNNIVTDLNLYNPGSLPSFAGIHLMFPAGILVSSPIPRHSNDVADEVEVKARQGVTTFAFYDPWLGFEHRKYLVDALSAIASRQISRIHFVALGNFSPRLIDENLASLLRQVGFKHIYLHDDIHHSLHQIEYLSSLDDYQDCVRALHQAGFRPRTDEIGAAILLGLPGENLDNLTNRLVQLSSIIGSLHLVPFQFTPGTSDGKAYENWLVHRNGHFDPTALNGRIFPLARLAMASYDDYLEITRLVALLNSKFHTRTFNFLGSGITSKLVRDSLREHLWDPFSERARKEEREGHISLPIKEDK